MLIEYREIRDLDLRVDPQGQGLFVNACHAAVESRQGIDPEALVVAINLQYNWSLYGTATNYDSIRASALERATAPSASLEDRIIHYCEYKAREWESLSEPYLTINPDDPVGKIMADRAAAWREYPGIKSS